MALQHCDITTSASRRRLRPWRCVRAFAASSMLYVARAFPSYDSPAQASPAIIRNGDLLCKVDLIQDAVCDGYDKIIEQTYVAPNSQNCPASAVRKVVLDIDGSVKGIQFDRYGTLFLGQVELIRTTTPEPTLTGIHWHVEKDLTHYLTHFLNSVPMSARLAVPNVIDDTYNGVIYINATLSFYGQSFKAPDAIGPSNLQKFIPTFPSVTSNGLLPIPKAAPPASEAPQTQSPIILPLLTHGDAESGLWGPVQLAGQQRLRADSIDWPHSNIATAYLDVFASPHACEEFWYSNFPDAAAAQFGSCGGGSFREILVYVDDHLAGAAYPFVVLYTGGINPFLWRPLTGIGSLDITAYRIDLTPFVGLFNKAKSTGSKSPVVSVLIHGAGSDGVWFTSGNLLLYEDTQVSRDTLLGGTIVYSKGGAPQVNVTEDPNHEQGTGQPGEEVMGVYKTVGSHVWAVVGNLVYPNGSVVLNSVRAELWSENVNKALGLTRQVTEGWMKDGIESQRVRVKDEKEAEAYVTAAMEIQGPDGMESRRLRLGENWLGRGRGQGRGRGTAKGEMLSYVRREDHYPYLIDSYYGKDNQTVEMRALIDITLQRSFQSSLTPDQSDPIVSGPANSGILHAAISSPLHEGHGFQIMWQDQIKSAAVYNRTLDHQHTYKMADLAGQSFEIRSNYQGPCYQRHMVAKAGSITKDDEESSCLFPPGLSFCTYSICNELGKETSPAQEQLFSRPPKNPLPSPLPLKSGSAAEAKSIAAEDKSTDHDIKMGAFPPVSGIGDRWKDRGHSEQVMQYEEAEGGAMAVFVAPSWSEKRLAGHVADKQARDNVLNALGRAQAKAHEPNMPLLVRSPLIRRDGVGLRQEGLR